MFSSRTVFIVGAGASHELGLPTGEKLKSDIAQILNITFPDGYSQKTGDRQIADILKSKAAKDGNRDWNYLLKKAWAIRNALGGAISIDNVLDAHADDSDLTHCGKLSISKSILVAERNSHLFSEKSDFSTIFNRASNSWLIPFFQILTEGIRKNRIHSLFENISIINFNYDRCVEYFLPQALSCYYNIKMEDSIDICKSLEIIHPYGTVGNLYGINPTPFGDRNLNISDIAKNIRTFTEGVSEANLIESINNSCLNAQKIVFLGFGFNPMNMDVLSTKSSSNVKYIYATTYGLSDAAKNETKNKILQTFQKCMPMDLPLTDPDAFTREIYELNLDSLAARPFLDSHFRSIA